MTMSPRVEVFPNVRYPLDPAECLRTATVEALG